MKFFATTPSTDEHAEVLAGLLDGSVALEGLVIDTDLRWELLQGLVLLGKAGETEIAAALEADNTASGQQAAANARATVPTAEAKRAAFDSLVARDDAPNAIVRAVGVGVNHVNDASLLSPLVEPYFESLNRLWKERSYHMASQIITGLYPSPLANEELRAASQQWLDTNPDAAPALRRVIVECLAGVERAIKVAAADI